MNRRIPLGLFFIVLLGMGSQLAAQRRPSRDRRPVIRVEEPPPASTPAGIRMQAFELVWSTINRNYFDPTFNRVDWNGVRKEFEPKVRRAKTDAETHRLLAEMIGRLKVSHLEIIPPEVYSAIETAKANAREREEKYSLENDPNGGEWSGHPDEMPNFDDPLSQYGIGVDVRILDGKVVITRITPGSAGEYAGLKLGYSIEKINDVSMPQLLATIALLYPKNERVKRYLPLELVRDFLNGERGSTVELAVIDESENVKELSIRRELIRAETVHLGGSFPPSRLQFESRRMPGDVGYIRFDNFSLPVIEKFCNALTEFDKAKAIVIDLRGNLGGVLGVTIGLAGMLSDKSFTLGTSQYRYGTERLEAQPKLKNFKGRIVVIVDGLSVSAAEIFASGLQEAGRAVIVGERSAGETLPSVSVPLPTGATLLYPIANFRTFRGKFIEGAGIAPDVVVAMGQALLLRGEDPQIAQALKILNDPPVPVEFKGIIGSGLGIGPPPPPRPAPPRAIQGRSDLPKLADVNVLAGPPPPAPKKVMEQKALDVIRKFASVVGTVQAFESINSFEMVGSLTTSSLGSVNRFDYSVYRSGNDKYAEVLASPATGTVKDIRNGETIHVKADWGLESKSPFKFKVAESAAYAPILSILREKDFTQLRYLGEFDRDGRKIHLIDAETTDGQDHAIYFDAETMMLAGYETASGGLSYSDYRTVGSIKLPFRIIKHGSLDIQFDRIDLNGTIDPAIFEHKINCYDRPVN